MKNKKTGILEASSIEGKKLLGSKTLARTHSLSLFVLCERLRTRASFI